MAATKHRPFARGQILIAILLAFQGVCDAQRFKVVAIIPSREDGYPSGLHNGLQTQAAQNNIDLEIRDCGNFDGVLEAKVLQEAIANPVQPDAYAIWPVNFEVRPLMKTLFETSGKPILQINQLPSADEMSYLVGYAGPDDALRARGAGLMLVNATREMGKGAANVAIVGYPQSYGGTKLSLDAFRGAIAGSHLKEVGEAYVGFGPQNGYLSTVEILDGLPAGTRLDGMYVMDDLILVGVYQALLTAGYTPGVDVMLVGTVCNGVRELLDSGAQYGTTLQAPMLEGILTISQLREYLTRGNLSRPIAFTPNPTVVGQEWRNTMMSAPGAGLFHMDSLCGWNYFYKPVAGLTEVSQSPKVCNWVECVYIPEALFSVGYALLGINYLIAAVSAALLFVYRSAKVVRFAQPSFLALVILGSAIDTSSIILMSSDNRNSDDAVLQTMCTIWPWLLSLGHMITTATLVAKIYRVKKVFAKAQQMTRVKVTAGSVMLFIALGLAVDLIVLIIWYSSDPFMWGLAVTNADVEGFMLQVTGQCTCVDCAKYTLVILLLHFAMLLYANVLAYQTREHAHISDSKPVAISLFNSVQLLVVVIPLLVMTADNVAVSYLIRVAFVFLNNFGVLSLIVVPRLFMAATGREDRVGINTITINGNGTGAGGLTGHHTGRSGNTVNNYRSKSNAAAVTEGKQSAWGADAEK